MWANSPMANGQAMPKAWNCSIILGDADGDGEVSIADVTKVVNYILTNETTGLIFENADVDGSGTLDINDISGIVAIILGN